MVVDYLRQRSLPSGSVQDPMQAVCNCGSLLSSQSMQVPHAQLPDGYDRKDQKLLCHLVDSTLNASFASSMDKAKLVALRAPANATATTPAAKTGTATAQ